MTTDERERLYRRFGKVYKQAVRLKSESAIMDLYFCISKASNQAYKMGQERVARELKAEYDKKKAQIIKLLKWPN